MAFNTPSSRIGQDVALGGSKTPYDIFLKVFSGEVLATFESTNVMMPLHRVRTISSGKSAQFPVTGVASAAYHTPGESLFGDEYAAASPYLSKPNHSELTIYIDNILQSSAFLSSIDEAMNHYDVRSMYSTEIGRQLAYHADKAVIRTVIAGARQTTDRFGSTNSGGASQYGGAKIVIAGASANATLNEVNAESTVASGIGGAQLIAGIFKAAELMDSKNVPSEGRYCLLPPNQYYKMINDNKDAINRDYGNEGNGSVAGGHIISVAGIRVLMTNHLPTGQENSSVLSSTSIRNNPFGGNNVGYGAVDAETKGIIFQSEGVGTVKLMDLAVESEYFMERMGTLMLAKYAMGHGVLRAECCYDLILNAATAP